MRLTNTVDFDETMRSPAEILTELATAVLMAADAGGIHAFLICVNLSSKSTFSPTVQRALEDLDKMNTIWPYVMLLFTNAGQCGETDEQRRAAVKGKITKSRCPDELSRLLHYAN